MYKNGHKNGRIKPRQTRLKSNNNNELVRICCLSPHSIKTRIETKYQLGVEQVLDVFESPFH